MIENKIQSYLLEVSVNQVLTPVLSPTGYVTLTNLST